MRLPARDRERRVGGDRRRRSRRRRRRARSARHEPVDEAELVGARGAGSAAATISSSSATRGGISHGSGAAHGAPRPQRASVMPNCASSRGDAEVGHLGEQEAAGEGAALDRGDHRLVDPRVALEVGDPVGRRDRERRSRAISLRSAPAQNDGPGAAQHRDARVRRRRRSAGRRPAAPRAARG